MPPPEEATHRSATGVATVSGTGVATITATVEDQTAQTTVSVSGSSISVTASDMELSVGDSEQLTATITGGEGLTVVWSSSG